MKNTLLWTLLITILLGTGFAAARAASPWRHSWCHRGPMGYLARQLHLSDAQRSQVQSMWNTERPAISPLLHELATESREMDAAGRDHFDPSRIQPIADRQAATVAKLLVEKERLIAQVYTILTPDQRAKADQMQDRWHDHMDRFADRLSDVH